jgi:hypothetical protein
MTLAVKAKIQQTRWSGFINPDQAGKGKNIYICTSLKITMKAFFLDHIQRKTLYCKVIF